MLCSVKDTLNLNVIADTGSSTNADAEISK